MPNKNTIRYLNRIRKRISLYFVISMVFLLCVPLLLFLSLSDSGRKLSAQIMRSADAEDYMIPALSYPFSVHFIDVGCGDCILIMQDDTVILADCGSFSADGRVSKYLKKLGVDHIDLFAATHTDSDHIGDFEDIARSFSIGKIWLHDFCRKSYESCSADEKIFYDTIKEMNIPVESPGIGKYMFDNFSIEVLSPFINLKNENENSLVMRICYQGYSFLLMGDAGSATEKRLLKTNALIHSDILKAGHHGSSGGTTDSFLAGVTPVCTVISAGEENKDLPSRKCIDRIEKSGSQILRTDIDGTIIIVYDNGRLTYIKQKQ